MRMVSIHHTAFNIYQLWEPQSLLGQVHELLVFIRVHVCKRAGEVCIGTRGDVALVDVMGVIPFFQLGKVLLGIVIIMEKATVFVSIRVLPTATGSE